MGRIFRKRLTNALEPFLNKSLKHEAIEKLRSTLGTIFEFAVEIRAESLLSANDFELIWPVAGSAANGAEMEAISSEPVADSQAIKLPLLPGLRAFSKKKTMVESRGFSRGALTKAPQHYVVKALVLC